MEQKGRALYQFMVEFDVPELTDDMMALIPEQRLRIDDLFNDRKLLSYALSMDRSKVWATVLAEDETEVIETVESLPMTYLMEYEICILAFNEISKPMLPAFSLN